MDEKHFFFQTSVAGAIAVIFFALWVWALTGSTPGNTLRLIETSLGFAGQVNKEAPKPGSSGAGNRSRARRIEPQAPTAVSRVHIQHGGTPVVAEGRFETACADAAWRAAIGAFPYHRQSHAQPGETYIGAVRESSQGKGRGLFGG